MVCNAASDRQSTNLFRRASDSLGEALWLLCWLALSQSRVLPRRALVTEHGKVQTSRVRTTSYGRCSLRTAPLGVLTDGCKNVDASGL